MYRAIASRRQLEGPPISGLLGTRGAIGTVYSVYTLPRNSCSSSAVSQKAKQSCSSAMARGDSFYPGYGSGDRRFPNGPGNPYEIQSADVSSMNFGMFDPCLVKSVQPCTTPAPPPVHKPQPPPPPPPPPTPPPPTHQPPRPPPAPPPIPDDPVQVFQEPEVEVVPVEEEPLEEEDSTGLYVIGGVLVLVVGGGMAYYLSTRKKKRR